MAFTVAHMAVALPFYKKRWLQFDALLIGTMMPDFPYYMGSANSVSDFSHQWLGVLLYCLPWGLMVFALWYWLLKPAAIGLIQPFMVGLTRGNTKLPNKQLNNRYSRQCHGNSYVDSHRSPAKLSGRLVRWISSFALPVVFGLIFGAATHLIWDGITHADGFVALHVDWLQYPVYVYPFRGTSIARLLQYLSSIVGLGALIWFAISRLQAWRYTTYKLNEQTELLNIVKPILTKKSSLLVIALIILFSLVWSLQAFLYWYQFLLTSPYTVAARLSVSVLQDIIIAFIGYAVIYHLLYLLKKSSLSGSKS